MLEQLLSYHHHLSDESSDEEKDNDDKKSYGKDRDRDDKSRDHEKYDDEKSYGKDRDESKYTSYDKDNSYKSKDSSVNIKKVKCNNINVNLNGLDVNVGLPFNDGPVTGLIAVAQEAEDDEESNSIERNNDKSYDGKDAQSDSDTNSRIVCINNNNNIVVGEEPEPPTCEECFTTVLTDEELDDLIQAIIENGGPDSLQGLCEYIASDLTEFGRAFISDRLFVLGEDVGIPEDKINEILDCLEEVFGGDFLREIIGEPLTAQQQMNWKS